MKEKRTISLTLKLTASEVASLRARAEEAGLSLRPYVRNEALTKTAMPSHAELLLAKIERLDELARRLWMAAAEDELRPEEVRRILQDVDAVGTGSKVA